MNTKIRVSGNIISELSEKIPTNIIALNELIKNSYDAGALSVTVELDTSGGILRIKDDGCGMDRNDIDTLFQIAKSTKVHGAKNEYDRITQGSKGLGFLSVFKFGKHVEWKTNKNQGFRFSVNYDQLISVEDLSEFGVALFEDDTVPHGTEIIIKLDTYNVSSLKNYFSLEKNYKKITNSFDDDRFDINLVMDKSVYSSKNKIPLLENEKNQQLYYVGYDCKTKELVFKHNDYVIAKETYPFSFKEFSLNIELVVFQLKPYGKEKIDKLFLNPSDDLTPLIYFNTNLFNNYTIFDPNIMRNIKSTLVLGQMIGFIRIVSENPLIDFNADRSQFLQNELTDSIKNFLYDINRKIQETGSNYKKYVVDFDFLTTKETSSDHFYSVGAETFIKKDFPFKDKVKIEIQDSKAIYSLFDRSMTLIIRNDNSSSGTNNTGQKSKKKLVPAVINLNCSREQEKHIPSEQIDLHDYISSVVNSGGESVDTNAVEVRVNGEYLASGILPSIDEQCEKEIEYCYRDDETGDSLVRIKFTFVEPKANFKTQKADDLLIYMPAKQSYSIHYNQFLDKLIEQIQTLKIDKYLEIISCSLRPIFELSLASIYKSQKYHGKFNRTSELADGVADIVTYIKGDKKKINEIDNATIIGYNNLNNMLNAEEFKSAIKNAHLGSHHSNTYITEQEIRHIAKYASLFIVITNEMINNPNIS